MNIFGVFTFGGLIKTFLPGFVWVIALLFMESDWATLTDRDPWVIPFVQSHPESALVLSIPASILLGLLSNIVVFMGINDRLIRKPFKTNNPKLWRLYTVTCDIVKQHFWSRLPDGEFDEELKDSYGRCTDVEIMLLKEVDVTKLAYVREQYWYYLEFQINLALSLVALLVGSVLLIILSGTAVVPVVLNAALVTVLISLACLLLIRAARKNYARHIEKMVSLLITVIPGSKQPPPAASHRGAGK